MEIANSVGKGGRNDPADVEIIRSLLARHQRWAGSDLSNATLTEDILAAAITKFQETACAMARPDGRVDPNGFTLKRLNLASIPGPRHKVFMNICWNPGPALTDGDFKAAAKRLGCEKEAIQAVAIVETRRQANDELGRPTILFERHKFRKFTGGAYNATHPDISGPQGGYGRFSAQYGKLRRAAMLDEDAALKSASWGAFQIMGFNHSKAGYGMVSAFVEAMIGSQSNQLDAFVSFVAADSGMKNAIIKKDWAAFARLYNGSEYKKNNYDTTMETEYNARISVKTANRK
ncbi:MAG: N-acetylmuramidase family protein [Pikeienuella sp.]